MSFIVKCGVIMRNSDLNCLARVISAALLPFSASSTSFLDARFPTESTIMNTLSSVSNSFNCDTISNLSSSKSVTGTCTIRLVSISKISKYACGVPNSES